MKKLIAVLLIIGFLWGGLLGCTAHQQQYAIQTSMIGIETKLLKTQYGEVEQLIRAKQMKETTFTDEEWRKLLNVDATIDMLMVKYDAIENMDVANMNIQDIKFMWQLAAQGYTQARSVIENHIADFNPSTVLLLKAFDDQAQMTSDRIDELLNNPNNANINQTLVLIAGALGLAVKVLGIGVAIL